MARYSESFRERMVARMLSEDAPSVIQLNREIGVSKTMFYAWREDTKRRAELTDPSNPENLERRSQVNGGD